MRRIPLVAAALLAVWLLACTAPPTGRQITAPSPTPTETPEATPTPGIARDEAVPGPLLLYRSEWQHGRGWTTLAVPLDGATLREIAGVEPIDLGENAVVTVSPDGRLVAGFGARDDALRVYETETWSETARVPLGDLAEHRQSLEFFWTPGGERLFAWVVHCSAYEQGGLCTDDGLVQLWSMGPASDAATLVADLDVWLLHGRIAEHAHLTPDGRHLVLLAPREDGEPFVAVLNLDTGEVTAEIPVPGLKFGRTAVGEVESEEVTGPGGARASRPGYTVYEEHSPAAVLADDGSTLYIVHAEIDRLTVVDVATGAVSGDYEFSQWRASDEGAPLESRGGIYRRSATVTEDGRYLLVSDQHSLPAPRLTVIDLDTKAMVFEDDTLALVRVVPGAQRVLALGPSVFESARFGTALLGLSIVDLDTFEGAAELLQDRFVSVEALAADGRYAYVSEPGPGGPGWDCNRDCTLVHVVDLGTGEVVAERMFHGRERLVEVPGR